MEWLDYADCAGDDPRRWDLDHVEVVDVQGYAASVCGDCPVRRECAGHAIDDRHDVGDVFNKVVEGANINLAIGDRVEFGGNATVRQTGVIRGGVALVGDYEPSLYAMAGRKWHGLKECTGCGRTLFSDTVRHEDRPEGSVRAARRGMCASCAYGKGLARRGRTEGVSVRRLAKAREAAAFRESGLSVREIADRMGAHERTVLKYLSVVADG